jgi:hypothetical protein
MMRKNAQYQLFVSKNGVVELVAPDGRPPKGFLPLFTGTREQAQRLQVRHCRLSRSDNKTYHLNSFSQELEGPGGLYEWEEKMASEAESDALTDRYSNA